jgi:hypothetical protein
VAWAGAVAQDLLAALFRGAALEQSAVRTLRAALPRTGTLIWFLSY